MENNHTGKADNKTAPRSTAVSRRRALGSLASVGSLAIAGCSSFPQLGGVEPLWVREFDDASGASPPVVTANHVLVGAQDKALYGLDPKSGETQFRYETGGPIETAPTAAGENGPYFVHSTDGDLYAVDTDGRLQWHKEGQHQRGVVASNESLLVHLDPYSHTDEGFDVRSGDRRFEQSIAGYQLTGLTEKTFVYREEVEQNQTRLVALSTNSGEPRWKTDTKSQYPRFVADEQLVVADRESQVCAYATQTGETKWQSTIESTGTFRSVTLGSQVYLYSDQRDSDDEIIALDRQTGGVVWQGTVGYLVRSVVPTPEGLFVGSLVEDPEGGILGRVDCFESDGTRRWKHVTEAPDVEELDVVGDLVVLSSGRQLVAIDRTLGEKRWSYESESQSRLSLAVALEQLYVSYLDAGAVARFSTELP